MFLTKKTMFLTQIFPQVFHPIIKQKLINLREIQIFLSDFPPLFLGDVYHKDAIFNKRPTGMPANSALLAAIAGT